VDWAKSDDVKAREIRQAAIDLKERSFSIECEGQFSHIRTNGLCNPQNMYDLCSQ
jgi:hypothetical protein